MPLHFADGGGGKRQKGGLLSPATEGGQDGGSLLFSTQSAQGPSLFQGCILPRGLHKAGSVPLPPARPCGPPLSSIRNGKSRSRPQTESELAKRPPTLRWPRVTLSLRVLCGQATLDGALLLFSVHPVPQPGPPSPTPCSPDAYTLLTGRPLLHRCPRPPLVGISSEGVVGGCPSALFPGNW